MNAFIYDLDDTNFQSQYKFWKI